MDEQAELYAQYHDKVFGYLLHKINSREDAEDLCSEVFLKVYSHRDSFDGEKSSLSTWIYHITRNTLFDYYRTRHVAVELDLDMAEEDSFEDDLCQKEMLEHLANGLETLPRRERDIILLHYYKGETLRNISASMGLSYGYVKSLHNRALDKLKKFLE